MKSELGRLLQSIADERGVRCPAHKTKWIMGRAKGNAKYKRTIGDLISYSKGSAIGGLNEDRPNRRRPFRRTAWKAKEEPRGYVAGDC